ncbi:Ketoreductase [Colletotrichum fructicola]|uniref:Ketoreductase n=1 Tax=Colletotrichum fructicola (strain Nara gc5) TaxID=1213859 RepID=L2FLS3_COLFN|nr:Ketoreductase [Colletotrichum fructicola]KAE9578308.1 Ketoreductase [Colletotrichum fructicola]KAF4886123.1 Ketoreductase azaE [Colletotrichum fructicola]
MSRVLLTGGSGFIAAHVLKTLLDGGHTVTTTVRSTKKGEQILAAYKNIPKEKLSYVIVSNIAREGAFDHAVQSDPQFDCVIHTASPFHENFDDPVTDLLDPAIKGTIGLLRAVKNHALQVKRVIITSSFAAIVNSASPPSVYDENSWNPITWDEAVAERSLAYRGSKKLAEEAAWKFVEEENPNFDLVTMNPPMVYGPVIHHLENSDSLNTSNQRIRDFIQGKIENDKLPPTGTFLFTDVRDLGLAHVRAMEVPEAAGKRFFITAGHYSNKRIVDAIRDTHPGLAPKLPKNPIDDFPEDVYGYDNSRARQLLGIEFRSLRECIGNTTDSFLKLGIA